MGNRVDIGNTGLEESAVVREIERKQAKQSMMLFWICLICFVIGIVGTIILWQKTNNQNIEGIEPVEVRVVDVVKKTKKLNGRIYTNYEVTVRYDGEEYELKNGGHSPWTYPGYEGTAYLYEGQIYASEGSVANSTNIGKLYFVFLFATFGLLFITPSVGSKAFKRRKRVLEKE